VVADDLGKLRGGGVQGAVPGHRFWHGTPLQALQGLQQAGLQGDFGGRRQVQRAALGAQPPEVGRVLRVAFDAGDLVAGALDDDATAHTAVGAGGTGFFHLHVPLRRCFPLLAKRSAATAARSQLGHVERVSLTMTISNQAAVVGRFFGPAMGRTRSVA
jgi:hypothetical protein